MRIYQGFFAAIGILFGSSAYAQTSFLGSGLVTTCEIQVEVQSAGSPLETTRNFVGAIHENVGAKTCRTLVMAKAKDLCKKYRSLADSFVYVWGFKTVEADNNPPPSPCTSPTDPQCYDPLLQAFKLQTRAAEFNVGQCSQFN